LALQTSREIQTDTLPFSHFPTLPKLTANRQKLSHLEQVREYIRASKAENTLRGYSADWRDFCRWSETHGVSTLPASPESVAAYIAECAGRLKVGSIQRRLNAIAEAHKAVGANSPIHHAIVANTMKGIRRTIGTAPVQKNSRLDCRHPGHDRCHGRGNDRHP
jgi:hypothetical protein